MWKKILLAILFIAVAGAGAFGTYHFYNENKTTTTSLEQVKIERDNYLAQVNQIGTMTTTYAIAGDILSGSEITEADLIEVHIPQKAIASNGYDLSVNPDVKASLVGRKMRCSVAANTIITPDMLMTEEEEVAGLMHYPIELTFDSLPVTLKEGDTIDLRFLLANGEEYVVLDHKIVKAVFNNTIQLHVSEEENAIINSLYSDLGVYSNCTKAYLFKYLEPGNKQTLSFYPVVTEMEDFLLFNPNITDITRCVNTTLRDHINEQLLILSDSANSGTSSAALSVFSTALSGQNSMRQNWLQEQEQAAEEGAVTSTEGAPAEGEVPQEEVDLEAIE